MDPYILCLVEFGALVLLTAWLPMVLTPGGAEMAHGYGFLSVFIAALVLRMQARGQDYDTRLHDFADELERLLMMMLLVAFGVLSTGALLQALRWEGVIFGLVALFLVRPVSGWIALKGASLPTEEKAMTSFYGNRGVGSVDCQGFTTQPGLLQAYDANAIPAASRTRAGRIVMSDASRPPVTSAKLSIGFGLPNR